MKSEMGESWKSRPLWRRLGGVFALVLSSPAAMAVGVSGQGTWETTLQSRDINGDGTVDAWYDTARHVSWLADARAILGSGFGSSDGTARYAQAKSWLAVLDVYGVTGWRFPGDDLVPLYSVTLGNSNIPGAPTTGWTNTGPFLNVTESPSSVSGWYWRGDTPFDDGIPITPLETRILAADGTGASLYVVGVGMTYGVWAVKDGDVPVAAIPEPETWALMLMGLAALASQRRVKAQG